LRALFGARIKASFDFLIPTWRTIAAHISPYLPALLLAFALIAPICFYAVGNRYLIDLGILIVTYTMLGLGLNIVVGLAGLLDLGYVAFYAVGAYSYALLAKTFGLSFWILLPLAGVLSSFWGILLGFPVLRLRGDYLAIVTLAFGEIIRLILINWVAFSGGYAGIASIPRITFFGLSLRDEPGNFGAFFGGMAGSFFAVRQGFISPESFTFNESATVLAIVVLGGMGSQIGVALAAIVMIGGTEILRKLDFLKDVLGADFDP